MAKKVFYICGPTNSGKTGFSVALAKQVPNAVFINADTMQLYQGLEPLAGHPTPEEAAQIDHRLFGVLPPERMISRSEWLNMATHEIQKAFDEEKQPILIGGSRSFAACLAKAAYGVDLPVDQHNAITFPEETTPLSFPFELHTISLHPSIDNIQGAVLKKIREITEPTLECLRTARLKGIDPCGPGFWVIGTKEFSDVLDHRTTLLEAHQKIATRAMAYAREQDRLFAKLNQEVSRKFPDRILEIPVLDTKRRLSRTLEFMSKDRKGEECLSRT